MFSTKPTPVKCTGASQIHVITVEVGNAENKADLGPLRIGVGFSTKGANDMGVQANKTINED
ncbi:hypothetical protein ACFWF7_43495 [Nocardia sp. NPDC060256]|uniref:hypothetical protein n=1 Tax=unclassified Nocardia TaxID=2637762 RepID=UPI0036686DF8